MFKYYCFNYIMKSIIGNPYNPLDCNNLKCWTSAISPRGINIESTHVTDVYDDKLNDSII